MPKNSGQHMLYKPKDMSLDIHSIIRPMITHAAVVWWPQVKLGVARAMLSRVQRLACLALTGAIRTSPTATLEVITGLLPLDIHIKQVAMTTSYKINSLKNWKRVQNLGSHSYILEKMHKEVICTKYFILVTSPILCSIH